MQHAVIATYVESEGQLRNSERLVSSLREFGGGWKETPVWVFQPDNAEIDAPSLLASLESNGARMSVSHTPEEARWFFYGGKPYAAAAAEQEATGRFEILVWLDDDTVVLQELHEMDLPPSESLAYCPVMHNKSGSLRGQPPSPFWERVYQVLNLEEADLFPMVTPADDQTIRAYFHCGQFAVRPEREVLGRWASDFSDLCRDSLLIEMCREDVIKRVFLHQTALTGAILHTIPHREMREFTGAYNYPIYFEVQFGGNKTYRSIRDAATIRCLVSPEKMGANWAETLEGPADRIAWLKEELPKGEFH